MSGPSFAKRLIETILDEYGVESVLEEMSAVAEAKSGVKE